MTSASTETAIEREVHIAAPPETVFPFLVDPARIVEWFARRVELEPRPGGLIRLDMNGFDIMRGEVVEIDPPTRLVYTFGWESLADTVAPGSSRVEITLARDGEGTLLRLVHSGLPELATKDHGDGWDHFLGRLGERATGGAPDAAPPLTVAQELASQLNSALVRLRWFIERCDDVTWKQTCIDDGRTVGVVAQHVVAHLTLAEAAAVTAEGNRSPVSDFAAEMLERFNAEFAEARAQTGREQTLASLKAEGPAAVERVKPLTAEQLERAQPAAFAGNAPFSAEQFLRGPLLADIQGHIANLERTLAG